MLLHYNSRPLQELSKYLKYETSILNKIFNSGLSNCSWSSCREGCTRDIFSCHHILVEYTYLQEDYRIMKLLREKQGLLDPSPTKHSAVLFVNVKVRRLSSLLNILSNSFRTQSFKPMIPCDTKIRSVKIACCSRSNFDKFKA